MRSPRRQVAVVGVAAALCATCLVVVVHRQDSKPGYSTGVQHIVVGSLQLPHNRSRFELPPGLDPYPWTYFQLERWQRRVVVPGLSDVQRAPRQGPESDELKTVQEAALAEVRAQTDSDKYGNSDVLGGRYRLIPGDGVQYEVYVHSREEATPTAFHTVKLTREFFPLEVQYLGEVRERTVNVILPYYNRIETLKRFVERFRVLVESGQDVKLIIVRYADGFPSMDQSESAADQSAVNDLVTNTNAKLAAVRVEPMKVVNKEGKFSRGGALMAGAAALDASADNLLFLCDVDIVFGRSLLQRCRANTEPARRAYFPVVFSSYNPDIVYGVIKKKPVPVMKNYERNTLINQQLGYWIDFGFGMSCQYLSDFRRLSGPFLNITGWGLEDVKLYEEFQKSDIEIVRMPDPDLVHVYHKKQCSKYEVGRRFNSCLKSKALNEASRLQWGLWVYKNMGDTDDVEEFLKLFKSNQIPGGQ